MNFLNYLQDIEYISSHQTVPNSMALQKCSRRPKEWLGFPPGALDQIGMLCTSRLELNRKRSRRSREEELSIIVINEFAFL